MPEPTEREVVARAVALCALYGDAAHRFAAWPVPALRDFTLEVADVLLGDKALSDG